MSTRVATALFLLLVAGSLFWGFRNRVETEAALSAPHLPEDRVPADSLGDVSPGVPPGGETPQQTAQAGQFRDLWAELEDLKRLGPAPATPPETLEQIDAILYSTDPEVKIQAIGKLAESTSAPGVKSAILTALRDPDETVRLAALNVLPKLEDTAVTPLLNGLARDDPSPRVRRRAASLARYTAPQ